MNNSRPTPDDPSARTWSVVRQDDNGNRFVARQGLSRSEAERWVAQYEALGHKQTYWVEPEGE